MNLKIDHLLYLPLESQPVFFPFMHLHYYACSQQLFIILDLLMKYFNVKI